MGRIALVADTMGKMVASMMAASTLVLVEHTLAWSSFALGNNCRIVYGRPMMEPGISGKPVASTMEVSTMAVDSRMMAQACSSSALACSSLALACTSAQACSSIHTPARILRMMAEDMGCR